MPLPASTESENAKNFAAKSSVLAAFFLTGMKITVGLMTGSLGILAEAAHSGLDMMAAIVTYLAVRVSDKPADEEHPYGHGKIENLSALFETVLLLATCLWIIHEAVDRLFFKAVTVQASLWAYLVIIISIAVDISRSRMLKRTAKKYNSQALEADALHFSTDIWSSAVVLLGLVGITLAELVPAWSALRVADSIAALGVALIVIYVSIEMGYRTSQALLDAAPKGMEEKVKLAAETVAGVCHCHNIRLRQVGPRLFVDAHVNMDPEMTLRRAHLLTDKVEQAIQKIAEGADVTVHAEPTPGQDGARQKSGGAPRARRGMD
jgi:cation diffusion facilitator family transporter